MRKVSTEYRLVADYGCPWHCEIEVELTLSRRTLLIAGSMVTADDLHATKHAEKGDFTYSQHDHAFVERADGKGKGCGSKQPGERRICGAARRFHSL